MSRSNIILPNTFGTKSGKGPLSDLDANFNPLLNGFQDSGNGFQNFCTVSGTPNSVNLTTTPPALSLAQGSIFSFFQLGANRNTGPATINVDTLGAKSVVDPFAGNPLIGGEIIGLCTILFDGTKFYLIDGGNVFPTGTVLDFAGTSSQVPAGFLLLDGASYATATYPALFAILGYTFGGSGANFNVPDCRGRGTIGAGQGSGLTNRVLGANGGAETVAADLAAHTHTATQGTHNHAQDPHVHAGMTYSQILTPGTGAAYNVLTIAGSFAYSTPAATASNQAASAGPITVNSAGSGGGHNNMQPFLAFNKIIKT
jgi:microcystin-dependent protein